LAREERPVVLPLHPRTRKAIGRLGLKVSSTDTIKMIEPVSYLDMICLQVNAHVILTDSGGVQKEAYYAGVPCVTLRDETEWIETIKAKVNYLAGADRQRILECYATSEDVDVQMQQGLYGDGHAAEAILDVLTSEKVLI
jgi:UDP-N-acetylglucosamine 2-epimerase